MTFVVLATGGAGPDISVSYGVGVFGGDVDGEVGEGKGYFMGPSWRERGRRLVVES